MPRMPLLQMTAARSIDFRPLAGWERAVFAVAALAGFLGIAFNDKAYYTMHAALFIGMAVILHTTRSRYLERVKAQAPE